MRFIIYEVAETARSTLNCGNWRISISLVASPRATLHADPNDGCSFRRQRATRWKTIGLEDKARSKLSAEKVAACYYGMFNTHAVRCVLLRSSIYIYRVRAKNVCNLTSAHTIRFRANRSVVRRDSQLIKSVSLYIRNIYTLRNISNDAFWKDAR